jgi:hypothetical protein
VLQLLRTKEDSSNVNLALQLYFNLFPTPSPHKEKMTMLRKYGGYGVWIETGTYLGETTQHLSQFTDEIHTIEPSFELYLKASEYLRSYKNIFLHNGTSEERLAPILEELCSRNVNKLNFWLDGHYSAGNTFKGEHETPVMHELSTIEKYANNFKEINIFIDDVRCFHPTTTEYQAYPHLNDAIEWAKLNRFRWRIARDIMVFSRISES